MKKILLTNIVALMVFSPQVFAQKSQEQEAQGGSSISADDFLEGKPNSKEIKPSIEAEPEKAIELTDIEKSIAKAKSELENKETLEKKISLAKEMHKIRPTHDQVDAAVKRASLSFPKNEQQKFINAMGTMLNYNAIERISVDAMIETYTLEELSSMVEYYSKPEAKSASKKVTNWARIVQPEVINMIDKAMMRIRTGK